MNKYNTPNDTSQQLILASCINVITLVCSGHHVTMQVKNRYIYRGFHCTFIKVTNHGKKTWTHNVTLPAVVQNWLYSINRSNAFSTVVSFWSSWWNCFFCVGFVGLFFIHALLLSRLLWNWLADWDNTYVQYVQHVWLYIYKVQLKSLMEVR